LRLAVPLNQLGALAGNQGQPRLMPMGGQGLSSSYTGWCDSAGANCTTFDGSNGELPIPASRLPYYQSRLENGAAGFTVWFGVGCSSVVPMAKNPSGASDWMKVFGRLSCAPARASGGRGRGQAMAARAMVVPRFLQAPMRTFGVECYGFLD